MKRLGFIITFLICFNILPFAQDSYFNPNIISQGDFDMKIYQNDKDAEAVVFFDLGKSYFDLTETGFKVVYERRTRIKILSESGVKWGEVSVPYYNEGNVAEEILDLEGITYNQQNDSSIKKSILNKKNSYDEKINNNFSLKKFAMPDVKVGSIIEYTYKIYSDYVFNLRGWNFQWEIPVIYSRYSVTMIPFYEYSWLFQGARKFDEKESYVENAEKYVAGVTYKELTHKFVMKNVPAFNDEKFITSKNDFITKIDFQLSKVNQIGGSSSSVITTWTELIKELKYSKDFGGYISKSEKTGAKNVDLQKFMTFTNPEERFNLVINYVKFNYLWNGKSDKFASKTVSDFEKQKSGNSADINLYAVGLLRSVGIDADAVLISTRDHGKIKYDYPYLHFFNDVVIVAYINGKKIITDATEPMCSNNCVSERCINIKGLIANEDKVEWVSMDTNTESTKSTNIKISLDKNNAFNANVIITGYEYDAIILRNKLRDKNELISENYKSQIYNIVDSTIHIANLNNKTYTFSFDITGNPEIINNKMYLTPFFELNLSENPLKKSERTYPIDMIYPKRTTFTSNIQIPSGWQINYLPEDKKIENELFLLEYKTTVNNNNIDVSFTYFFKKSVYSENYYILLKSYFNEIINKGNDKIVLSVKQ